MWCGVPSYRSRSPPRHWTNTSRVLWVAQEVQEMSALPWKPMEDMPSKQVIKGIRLGKFPAAEFFFFFLWLTIIMSTAVWQYKPFFIIKNFHIYGCYSLSLSQLYRLLSIASVLLSWESEGKQKYRISVILRWFDGPGLVIFLLYLSMIIMCRALQLSDDHLQYWNSFLGIEVRHWKLRINYKLIRNWNRTDQG